ncbi:hypothetical protein BKA57DRAFT_181338 [Linnemannia elongata]|nr:hypothetical protein BKA57DRAFT_181338 [Linnemannia elongata]
MFSFPPPHRKVRSKRLRPRRFLQSPSTDQSEIIWKEEEEEKSIVDRDKDKDNPLALTALLPEGTASMKIHRLSSSLEERKGGTNTFVFPSYKEREVVLAATLEDKDEDDVELLFLLFLLLLLLLLQYLFMLFVVCFLAPDRNIEILGLDQSKRDR